MAPGQGSGPAPLWGASGAGAVVDGVLTYNQEVGWTAAQVLHRQGEAVVKPDQPQAARWALAAIPSPARKAGAGSEPSPSLWPAQQLQLSPFLGWVVIKASQLLLTSSSKQVKCQDLGR